MADKMLYNLPTLTKENYQRWKFDIKAALESIEVLDIVDGSTICPALLPDNSNANENLKSIGEKITEAALIAKIINDLPKEYDFFRQSYRIAAAAETVLTLSNIQAQLQVIEQDVKNNGNSNDVGEALVTKFSEAKKQNQKKNCNDKEKRDGSKMVAKGRGTVVAELFNEINWNQREILNVLWVPNLCEEGLISLGVLTERGFTVELKVHLDVKTAFLYGKLEEELYLKQPEGFTCINDGTNQVCRLKKGLYGLKQASRTWNKKLNKFLEDFGLKRVTSDQCVYFMRTDGVIVILGIYVDDGVLC
ncbi:uncharacterized protein LOC114927924, partial [Nylanderia fulva]|uniref:uncharacterized protein LOC114927924 n=1 Tax=Nylanderia fulva TaxID=613905 RepID=UPI0010FAE634